MNRKLALAIVSVLATVACGEGFDSNGPQGGSSQGAGGTTSGSGGGSGATGGSGGTTTSSGGGPPVECPQDTVYAPPVPAGWEGPFLVASGTAEEDLPACPESGGEVLMAGLGGDGPATCPCDCGIVDQQTCSATIDSWIQDATCTVAASSSVTIAPDCTALGLSLGVGARWEPTSPGADACDPINGDPVVPEPSWSTYTQVCEVTPVEGGQCTPLAAGFDAVSCVRKVGTVACPDGYPVQRAGFTGLSDGRACAGDCSCDPSSALCRGHVLKYGLEGCGSSDPNKQEYPANVCVPGNGGAVVGSLFYQPAVEGNCTPGGGTPTGTVEKTGLTGVCCTAL
jgi:hypothetical protein